MRIRWLFARIAADKRYIWFRRCMSLACVIWAGLVVTQSIAYYVYLGQGNEALKNGSYDQAGALFSMALTEVENSLSYRCIGERDSRHSNALNNLAEYYRMTAQYPLAEATYLRVQRIARKQFGEKSLIYAMVLTNIGSLEREEGKYTEAESDLNKASQVWQRLKATGDVRYAAVLSALGRLYRDEGHLQQAENMYRRAWEMRLRAYGLNEDTAEVAGNLATIYREQARYPEALKLAQLALTIDTQLFGLSHPYTAGDLYNEAAIWRDQGYYDNAQPVFHHVLAFREVAFGKNHPTVAKTLLGLSENCRLSGHLAAAGDFARRALQIDQKALGKDHPDYATACDTMCAFHLSRAQSDKSAEERSADLQQAQNYIDQALRVRRRVLPAQHLDLAASLTKQGDIYRLRGNNYAASCMYKEALQIQEKALGYTHPATRRTAAELSLVEV